MVAEEAEEVRRVELGLEESGAVLLAGDVAHHPPGVPPAGAQGWVLLLEPGLRLGAERPTATHVPCQRGRKQLGEGGTLEDRIRKAIILPEDLSGPENPALATECSKARTVRENPSGAVLREERSQAADKSVSEAPPLRR